MTDSQVTKVLEEALHGTEELSGYFVERLERAIAISRAQDAVIRAAQNFDFVLSSAQWTTPTDRETAWDKFKESIHRLDEVYRNGR